MILALIMTAVAFIAVITTVIVATCIVAAMVVVVVIVIVANRTLMVNQKYRQSLSNFTNCC